jgi:hypothetical protein
MTEHKDIQKHPEGVEVAIGVLRNVPEEMLIKFLEKQPNTLKPQSEVWNEIIDNWFEEK